MGRFWHPRGMVLARVGQFLQTRIPVRVTCGACAQAALLTPLPGCVPAFQEVAEVRIENEKQLDDSAENF